MSVVNSSNTGAAASSGDIKNNSTTNKSEGSAMNPQIVDNSLNEEYIDVRSVTIVPISTASAYRQVNILSLSERRNFIGASVESSRILSSNKAEIDSYFPQIIGEAPENSEYMRKVKQYLSNIQIPVADTGKSFNVSFRYNTKKDYLAIVEAEEKVEKEYLANKQSNLKEALRRKINEINRIERGKYKIGTPINLDDYLMYRHCWLYNDIAKDTAVINNSKNIRFYFKDDQKELNAAKKARIELNKAKANYVALMGDDTKFNAVYVQYCIYSNVAVSAAILKEDHVKQDELDRFSITEPIKFNKIFNDRDLNIKSMVELLIAKGQLNRIVYNQNVTNSEGELIGANMKEVVAWFKDGKNASAVGAYSNFLNI